MSAALPSLLVIDDERVDRAIAIHAATRAGFSAQGVSSLAEARALLLQGAAFSVVVLDLSLGRDDGLRVLHMLAEMSCSAKVVFASGFDGRVIAASRQLAIALGLKVGGMLRKPIRPEALRELLRAAPEAEPRASLPGRGQSPEALQAALDGGLITPWFQPKVMLSTGEVTGAEALARWVQPDGGLISPADFIPVAVASGLIVPLTEMMISKALAACASWRQYRPDCSVALNIAPQMLDDATMPDRIERALQSSMVPASSLVLEITEGAGIPDTACATEVLTRLRIRGVSLAVDDFGTGYSSLLSLVRMPFTELKIDQAFVREADRPGDFRKVVYAAAALGRQLGLTVVAEGVETAAIAQVMRDAGCHVGQGWLFGRALPAESFEQLLGTGWVAGPFLNETTEEMADP
jgi:EAL domain-containing protein (putative c-di-GMP-specific phosphodiesterase class I)/ActR/RegA family two-component response regulator